MRKADDEVDPRQVEDEEADVDAELRVGRAEGSAVAPQQEGVPLGRGREPGEEPDGERSGDRRGAAHRLDELAVVLHRLRVGRGGVDRAVAVGDVDARPDHGSGQQAADDAEQHLGDDLGAEDAGEVDGLVPEDLGPELCRDAEHDHEHAGDDERRDKRLARGWQRGRVAPPRRSAGAVTVVEVARRGAEVAVAHVECLVVAGLRERPGPPGATITRLPMSQSGPMPHRDQALLVTRREHARSTGAARDRPRPGVPDPIRSGMPWGRALRHTAAWVP